MKKLLAILLAAMMVFALAACGDNNTTDHDKDSPGVSQNCGESTNDGGDTNLPESVDIPVDKYPFLESLVLPDNAVVTSVDDEYYTENGIITIIVKPITTSAQVDAYKDKLKNAGYTDAEVAGLVSPDGKFEMSVGSTWVEISGYIDLTIYDKGSSQTGNQGSEDNSGTTEPDNTGNGTENNDVDTWTVENFLKLYGFDAEDLKPNHFTSFEELEIVGSTEPGKRNSKGIVKINVEKGKTTADDYNAWFENLYAKMTELSDDGKLWYTGGKAMEAPTIEDLKAEAWWATRPGSTCYITVNENGKSTRINLDYSYDLEAEQYKVIILVHSVS